MMLWWFFCEDTAERDYATLLPFLLLLLLCNSCLWKVVDYFIAGIWGDDGNGFNML